MKEFKLPELGENITSADVLKVLVKPGDNLQLDQIVLEIETDKATIEVPSTVAGIVKEILIKEGDKAKVGQVILVVNKGQTAAEVIPTKIDNVKEKKLDKPQVKKSPVSTGIIEFTLPELGENIQSADVLKVAVKSGDVIQIDQTVLEIETDKATVEVPSTVAGKVIDVFVKSGDKISPGQVVLKVEADVSENIQEVAKETKPTKAEDVSVIEKIKPVEKAVENKTGLIANQPPIAVNNAPAAPSVRRFARELGVDINLVPGSGPANRISIDDVKVYVKKLNEGRIQITQQGAGVKYKEPLPDFTKYGSIEHKPMTNIRVKTAEHLSYGWSTIPHVTQFDKADVTELEKRRKEVAKDFEKSGAKLTATAYLVKVVSQALKIFPQFNSSVDMERKEIIYKNYINIGIAVDTENGLIVPVVKNVDQKDLTQIAIDIAGLAEKARKRKISLEDLQGGCFTISNLGGIGGTYFTPIVNSPEVAILGVSRSQYESVYKDGQFVSRLMLPLALSYDHRVIDGADAIRFLRWIIEVLESPSKILA
jgi:pyruvate dehydrogenase E2 component (dihydrolipoamide acetyltransferase)